VNREAAVDETELRRLATELLARLPDEVVEQDRGPVRQELPAALTRPEGEGLRALLPPFRRDADTLRWLRENGSLSAHDEERSFDPPPGDLTMDVGYYYRCPRLDSDRMLDAVPAAPPFCPVHRIPMVRIEA